MEKRTNKQKYDVVGNIISHESGELDGNETLELFSHLIKNGMAWTLQGAYGRAASSLIDNGYISSKGKIVKELE